MAKAAKTIKVEQTGSAIRRHHSQRETLIGLKLNKIGRVSELKDTPASSRHDRQGSASRSRRRRKQSEHDPESGNRFSVKIMLKDKEDYDEAQRYRRQRRLPQEADARRPWHRLGQGQDRGPRRQGPDRALGRAHQGLRGRSDAAASAPAEARLQQHLPPRISPRSISTAFKRRSMPSWSTPRKRSRLNRW